LDAGRKVEDPNHKIICLTAIVPRRKPVQQKPNEEVNRVQPVILHSSNVWNPPVAYDENLAAIQKTGKVEAILKSIEQECRAETQVQTMTKNIAQGKSQSAKSKEERPKKRARRSIVIEDLPDDENRHVDADLQFRLRRRKSQWSAQWRGRQFAQKMKRTMTRKTNQMNVSIVIILSLNYLMRTR